MLNTYSFLCFVKAFSYMCIQKLKCTHTVQKLKHAHIAHARLHTCSHDKPTYIEQILLHTWQTYTLKSAVPTLSETIQHSLHSSFTKHFAHCNCICVWTGAAIHKYWSNFHSEITSNFTNNNKETGTNWIKHGILKKKKRSKIYFNNLYLKHLHKTLTAICIIEICPVITNHDFI